jgi:putative membrane protein
MDYRLVTGLLLGCLIVLFIVQNAAVVEIRLLFWTFAMSRALMIFLVLAIGMVLGWLTHGYLARKRRQGT